MQNYNEESETTHSEQGLYPTREPSEPLMSITDVLQWDTPEKFPDVTEEESAVIADAISKRSEYDIWKQNPNSNNLYSVVRSLNPTIQATVRSLGSSSPSILSKARVLAAKAVKTYDPLAGGSLLTWVSNNLRQLSRDIRKSNTDILIPEGVQLDAFAIYKAELELTDELGREPTVGEIADRAKLSIKRITDVRRKNKRQGSESGSEDENGQSVLILNTTDYSNEALTYVYEDADIKDKKIIEYITGFGGVLPLQSADIMKKLGLTPVQLTRRKMRLSQKVMELKQALEEI